MTLLNIRGRERSKNVNRYLVKWDGKSRSKLQFKVKQFFKFYWKNHIVYEEFPVYGSLMKVDFINATKRIAVEVDGDQHDEFNEFFHNNSRTVYLKSMRRDQKKLEWLELNKFKVIQIKEKEVDLLSREFFKEKFSIDIV